MKALPHLDRLSGPADLASLTDAELSELADELRYRIKETVSAGGGHLASNLGVVELTLALHRVFDFRTDRLLWDVGHQAYVHKLLTGRAERFASNRQEGGLSGFPDPKESAFDVAKVGHSSTAISTGVGVAEGLRRAGAAAKVVVVVGDGALTGGMSFEGLINAGELKVPLLVVLNDNGSFIDPPTGSLHSYLDHVRSGRIYNTVRKRFIAMLKKMPGDMQRLAQHAEAVALKFFTPGFIFEDLGFRYFGPVDGHDRREVERMLSQVRHIQTPVLLHIHTKKGGGWEPAVKDPLLYHAGKDFDLDSGVFALAAKAQPSFSDVFAQTAIELAELDPALVAITAAMPSGTGLRRFGQVFPDRLYDVGICEQHSFGFAEGLAVAGLHPLLAHYSTFAQRGYDQLFQELVVQRDLGVVLTLDRAGLVGEDGETHQGLYDISWARALPGTVLLAPKDGPELAAMLRWAHARRLPAARPGLQASGEDCACTIIRYPKEAVPDLTWGLDRHTPIAYGKAELLRRGRGLMIWAYGVMVARAWEALASLGMAGEDLTLVNARFAKPLDLSLLQELAPEHQQVVSIEDHTLPGGFGSILAEAISDARLDLRLTRLGVEDRLVPHAPRARQLQQQGLDAESIASTLRRLLALPEADARARIIRDARFGGA